MAGIFNAGDLASIRSDLNGLLPGTCNILSLSRTSDGMGGGSVTWGTATAGVACDVWRVQRQPEEAGLGRFQEGSELVASAEYTFALPYDTSVDEQQRIEYGGEQFQVIAVDDTLPDQLQLRVRTRRTESTT